MAHRLAPSHRSVSIDPVGTPQTLEPSRASAAGTETETDPRLAEGDGDHDRFAHYVRKDDIVRSAVEGVPVIALCGKRWIPNRNPDRYPVCPECKELYGSLT